MASIKVAPGTEIVPVIVPTRDEQGAVGRTVAVLFNACFALGKLPMYIHASCVGYAQVRTNSFREAKTQLEKQYGRPVEKARGWLIDDDILLTDLDAVVNAMRLADEKKWNITAPYRAKSNKICVTHANGNMFTLDEFSKLKPYETVPMAGLGCYYGDIPLNYNFHADGKPFTGEDLNFFYDNKDLELRVAPIPVKHLKVIAI